MGASRGVSLNLWVQWLTFRLATRPGGRSGGPPARGVRPRTGDHWRGTADCRPTSSAQVPFARRHVPGDRLVRFGSASGRAWNGSCRAPPRIAPAWGRSCARQGATAPEQADFPRPSWLPRHGRGGRRRARVRNNSGGGCEVCGRVVAFEPGRCGAAIPAMPGRSEFAGGWIPAWLWRHRQGRSEAPEHRENGNGRPRADVLSPWSHPPSGYSIRVSGRRTLHDARARESESRLEL